MADLSPGTVATELLQAMKDGGTKALHPTAKALERTGRQVSDAAAQLRKRGLLQSEGIGLYRLTEDGVQAASRGHIVTSGPVGATGARRRVPKTFRQRAWFAMRFRKQFTLGDILIDATDGDKDPRKNLVRLVRYLCWTGYIVELKGRQRGTKQGSNGFKRYRLMKNTGPKVPIYSKARETLLDQNTGEEFSCKPNR